MKLAPRNSHAHRSTPPVWASARRSQFHSAVRRASESLCATLTAALLFACVAHGDHEGGTNGTGPTALSDQTSMQDAGDDRRARAAKHALPSEADLGQRAYEHVERVLAFGPRLPGSPAIRLAADYICARLRALGLTPIREAWNNEQEKLRFENVRVRIPGRSRKTLLIGTHYDTKLELEHPPRKDESPFTGANDGGSGTGLLLALAEELVGRRLQRPSIELVWFDGEESITPAWDMDRALFGSREFVRRHLVEGHSYGAFVLLDMVGAKKLAIDRDEASTAEMFPAVEAAVKRLGYERYFFQSTTNVDDDHIPFIEKGLPSIDLIQFEDNPHWHTYGDTIDVLSSKSLGIVGRVVLSALPALETRFLR